MKKYICHIIVLVFILISYSSCNDIDLTPYDGLTESQILSDPEGSQAIMNGVYSLINDHPFPRAFHIMFDWNSDNSTQAKTSGSSSFFFYTFKHTTTSSYVRGYYQTSYQAIAQANLLYDGLDASGTVEEKQMKGEALFMRSVLHFYLLQALGRPYNQSPETNLGIIYMRNANPDPDIPRSTVRECIDWLIEDFLEAAELMTVSRPNPYGSKEAAYAMLSRIYLYDGQFSKAIEYSNKVISSPRYELLDGDDLVNAARKKPEDNTETIFCIKKTKEDYIGSSAIGYKYYQSPGGVGSKRVFVAEPLRNALFKHMEDKRIWAHTEPHWVKAEEGEPQDDEGYLLDENGERVWEMARGLPVHMVLKYSNQEDEVLLNSPVIVRLAEMYLNRAEANAKLGNDDLALDDVNLIRERAGLEGDALYSTDNMQGFDNVLDIVLEERWLELMFEGHRSIDLWRNGKTLDNNYPGVHNPTNSLMLVPPDHPRVVQFIPEAEMILNDALVQNP